MSPFGDTYQDSVSHICSSLAIRPRRLRLLFISIDDNEAANLIKICDEVFGNDCFVANISWQRTYSTRNDSQGIVSEVEHIVVYSRNPSWSPNKLPRTDEMNSLYKSPDNDPRPWTSSSVTAPGAVTHQGMVYAIQHPFSGEMMYPTAGRCWTLGQWQMLENLQNWCSYELRDIDDAAQRASVCGIEKSAIRQNVKAIVLTESLDKSREKAQAVMNKGCWPYFYFTNGGQGGIRRKTYLDEMGGRLPTNFWSFEETGHTDEAKKEIKSLFDGSVPFDTPKPTRLLDRILTIATDNESIVMDFFSGSATTAHAVIKKNAETTGNRKFIMVQLPEQTKSPDYPTICDIGKERVRRSGRCIKEENPLTMQNLDIGFRVLKVDSTNMRDVYYSPAGTEQSNLLDLVDNIKPDRTGEDLLFQVMLELGVLLSSKIEQISIGGKTVYSVEDGYLLACFDRDVTDDVVKEIAKRKPWYFVMRDSSLADDATATNFEQIFQTYSPTTIRKVL